MISADVGEPQNTAISRPIGPMSLLIHLGIHLERRGAKIRKGAMLLTESGSYGVPREIVLPTSTIAFLGNNIACPKHPKEYLRLIYGDFDEVVYTYVDAATAKNRRQADTTRRDG